MKKLLLIAVITLCGCASQVAYVPPPLTASQYYGKLSGGARKPFQAGYTYGMSDEVGRMENIYRNMMRKDISIAKETDVRRSIMTVPVAPYYDADGVLHDSSQQYVTFHKVE